MGKFTIGSQVVCIEDENSLGKLTKGYVYGVSRNESQDLFNDSMVTVANSKWNANRFVTLTEWETLQQPIKKDLAKENTMKSSTKIPHIHAELIKLWADGVEIEQYSSKYGTWVWSEQPTWSVGTSYRVKPEQSYPATTANEQFLAGIYGDSFGEVEGVINVANEAIKHFIVSGDMDKYIESIK